MMLISLIVLLQTTLAFDTVGNNSEIFVSYAGHSEAKENLPIFIPEPDTGVKYNTDSQLETDGPKAGRPDTVGPVEGRPEIHGPETRKPEIAGLYEKAESDVVFVPNDRPIFRNGDDYLENDPVEITDVMNNRRIGDVARDVAVTEGKNEDILFVSGKNNENVEHGVKKNLHEDSIKTTNKTARKKLDCSNLNCDNIVKSVCGGRMDENKWKFRLFSNECFFRKVNCAFRYPNNRYKIVGLDKCSQIGHHSNRRPDFHPIAMPLTSGIEETRRRFSSRRALNADINGQACSHPCPIVCTERYEPQCAVSNTGQHHTFLNHCKLDYNSCLHKVVWYVRPLSECVGGKKADVQQNKGFIAWMQKVGIVDNRGRLALSNRPRPR